MTDHERGRFSMVSSSAMASLPLPSSNVARAQNAMVLMKRSIALLLVLTVVAFAACVLLAVRRGRTVMVLLLASAVAMIVVRALVRKVVAEAPTLVLEPGARAAVGSTINTLASGLLTAVTVLAVVGLVLALGLYLAGNSKAAVSLRGRAGAAGSGVSGVLAAHGDAVAIAAFGSAALVIFFAGLGIGALLVAVLLALLGAWALRSSASSKAAAG